jgi:acyl transferase domain-containing protein
MTQRKILFMFSGMGSQYYGMGAELYRTDAMFRHHLDRCDQKAQRLLGQSTVDLLYRERADPFAPFDRTVESAPALLMIQYSLARTLMDRGFRPSALLGYSMGELAAAAISDIISIDDVLHFVVEQAEWMRAKCEPAGMLAVLAPTAIRTQFPEAFRGTTLAGINFSRHFVVTGCRSDLSDLHALLKKEDILCQLLPIEHGFHSPLIDPAYESSISLMGQYSLRTPKITVYSCALRRSLGAEAPDCDYFWQVYRQPVYFLEMIQNLEQTGPWLYCDLGPAGSLANFVKYSLESDSRSGFGHAVDQFGRNATTLQALESDLLQASQLTPEVR